MLHVDGLCVTYSSPTGPVAAVRGVSLQLAAGDCLGIVGESGCGKSSLAHALPGLLPAGASCQGSVTLHGQELVGLPEAALRKLRGARMALVPQAAMSALDPVLRIGRQLTEPLAVHRGHTGHGTRRTAGELLSMVGLPPQLARAYPHELSGGMRQRAVIAAALAAGPDLLIADEPTTGLDVLAQAEVLGLLRRLRLELGLGLLLISHDLRAVLAHADRVLVLYAGAEVETGPPAQLATRPRHPYTAGLLDALPPLHRDARGWTSIPGTPPDPRRPVRGCAFAPRCPHVLALCRTQEPVPQPTATGRLSCHLDELPTRAAPQRRQAHPRAGAADQSPPVLEIRGLTVDYRRAAGRFDTLSTRAVDDVDLVVSPRTIVGLVGVSGSGKTTVARAVLRLVTPTAGSIRVSGTDVARLGPRLLRSHRRRVGLVPQDSFASLHPAMRVADLVAEPLRIAGRRRGATDRVRNALATVGLDPTPDLLAGYPARLSGGQRQRIALARALVGEPDLLIADEPTSMLDASVRAGVAATLSSLTGTLGLAILIITHDLAEAAQLCDQIYVLSAGRIVEAGPTERVLSSPGHPDTRALLDAAGQQGRTRTHLPPQANGPDCYRK